MLNQYIKNLINITVWVILFSSYVVSQTSFDIDIPSSSTVNTYSKISQKSGSGVSLGDFVWFDYNQNGLQDFGEQGIHNIKVNLYNNSNCENSPAATTFTSDIGYYVFDNLTSSSQKYCIEIVYPDKWTKTLSNVGNDQLNSDISSGTSTKGHIKNIILEDNQNLDIGLHHSDINCKSPLLKENDIGRYDTSKAWSKRYMLSVEFNGVVANGFCHEYLNGGPKTDDKYTVHHKDRLGFTDQQRDYLSRVFGFMSDSDVHTLIQNTFDTTNKQVWFNIISATFVWYYSDWDRSFQKLENFIDTKEYLSSLTLAEKQGLKQIARVVLNKTEGINGIPQYPILKVYYLWNETNDKNQDIIVPVTSLVPKIGECQIPSEPAPELSCTSGYTKLLKSIWTAGRNDSNNLITKLFSLSGEPVDVMIEKVWTHDVGTHQQSDEQFKIVFTNSSNLVLATTNYTNDIINEGNNNHQFTNLGKTPVPEGATNAILVHKADSSYGENLNTFNSVTFKGMCYKVTNIGKPSIEIDVSTNGSDADAPTGPSIEYDAEVTWKYVVKNTGNVTLNNVVVTDDKLGQICTVGSLEAGASKTCSKTGKAVEGQYANVGTVKGNSPSNVEVKDTDPSHYKGGEKPSPSIEIEVSTNGSDADAPTGPSIEYDAEVTWKYVVKNTGNVTLNNVVVTDDKLGQICTVGSLEAGASKTCSKTGKAVEGQYANVGTVKGNSPSNVEVKDTDPSHYKGGTKVINFPVVTDDKKSGKTGQPVTLDTLSNDKGIDSDLNPSSVVLVHANVQDNGKKLLVQGEGSWSVNNVTGQITFKPEDGFTKDPTPVKYTVEDMNGNVSNKGTEYVDYPQTAPTANDDKKVGERCKAITLDILSNDLDNENDLNKSSVTFVALLDNWLGTDSDNDGDIDNVEVPNEGKWNVAADGKVTYIPTNDCSSNPTSIFYKVIDKTEQSSNKATITVVYPEAEKASLGNLVWFDADKNGQQDQGEPGLEGVTVELYDANDELNETTVTDANGSYTFVSLEAGEYVIKFIEKDGYRFTLQNAQDISKDFDSDADSETGKTASITLNAGENNVSIDAGMYIAAKPSIQVVKTTNDGNVSNIIVGDTITWKYKITNTGNVVLSEINIVDDKEGNITNCNGDGSLVTLSPTKSLVCTKVGTAILGSYTNKVVVKAKDDKGQIVEDEDSSSYEGKETPEVPAKIGNFVWLDSNRNGIQDATELPLKDIEVKLYNENRELLAVTKTNDQGEYYFNEVFAGNYYLKFTVPNGYSITTKGVGADKSKDSDVNTNGKTTLFVVEEGTDDLSIDLGLYPSLTNLGDKVFLDSNANGIQDADETQGVPNVTVKLYREDNTFIDETTTTSTGLYFFRNLVPANYYIEFVVPENYKVSPQNQGGNESGDSDPDSSGKTEIITLVGGQDNKSVDMGLYQEGIKVGDRVFYDINKNGVQDSEETGIADVKVILYSTQAMEAVAETKTSASGIYRFEDIEAGEYYIQFIAPAGYTITKPNQGDKETDSNPNTSGKTETFTLKAGEQDSTIDMGLYQNVVSFGDRVFLDSNHNGLQDADEKGVRDVNVTIYSETSDFSKSMLTDENGNYLFRNLAAGEYYVEFQDIPFGFVSTEKDVNNNQNDLIDSDAFTQDGKMITDVALLTPGKNDLSWDLGIYKTVCLPGKAVIGNLVFEDFNKDGIQDVGEHGVANVKVTLYNNDTDEELNSTVTDENGMYEFAHVDPEYNYYIIFKVPDGFVVSPQDQDEETIDSDADENGKTEVISLEADKIDSTIDMGIYREGSFIGDRVFFDDLNGVSNGLQDEGELGANDVKVTLYNDQGLELNSTRTNVSGEYYFTNVPKGRYTIGFSEIPSGYVFTTSKQGHDDEKDSDAKTNGRTDIIFVDGKLNLTSIDAGLKKVSSGISVSDIKRGVIGENVTLDVLANDTEGTFNFDITTLRITSIPNGATLSEDGKTLTVPNEGVWRIDPETGAITFTPADGFVGDPTPISYSVQDTQGNESGADVEINYPPLAKDDSVNAEPEQQVLIYVLENDSNTSSPLDPATVRLIDPGTGDEVETLSIINEGTWSINIDGSVTFVPDVGLLNNPRPIEYIVREIAGDVSNMATIIVLYPDAVDDIVIVPKGDNEEIIVNVSDNDSNNTIPSEVTIGCEDKGVSVLIVPGEGQWRVSEGNIIFTPEDDFIAEPSDIQYTIGLVSGERSNCARIDIRRELLVMNDTTTLNVGSATFINVLSNDLGSLNAQSVKLVLPENPKEGTTLSDDGKTLTVPSEGVWSVNDIGIVSFTPEDGFSSVPTPIRYTVENNNGLVSNIGTIILAEGGISVVANDDIGDANGGEPVVIDVLANDSGDINRSSVRIITPEGKEVLSYTVPGEGTWSVGDDGSITFTGEVGFIGTPTSIEYIVDNNSVVILSDTATVSINGTCVCKPYEASIPAMGQLAALIMLLLTLLLSSSFLRKTEFS
jgi:CshA-type fibril repeat protein